MNFRAFFIVANFLVVSAVLVAEDETASKPTRPNIILVMSDDQGWGDVGYNGHPLLQTPHLDAAASAGLRFDGSSTHPLTACRRQRAAPTQRIWDIPSETLL